MGTQTLEAISEQEAQREAELAQSRMFVEDLPNLLRLYNEEWVGYHNHQVYSRGKSEEEAIHKAITVLTGPQIDLPLIFRYVSKNSKPEVIGGQRQ
jgi:hypothetical protein